jgi:hypothetical protein
MREVPLEFLSAADVESYLRYRLASETLPDSLAPLARPYRATAVHDAPPGPLFARGGCRAWAMIELRGGLARAPDRRNPPADDRAGDAVSPPVSGSARSRHVPAPSTPPAAVAPRSRCLRSSRIPSSARAARSADHLRGTSWPDGTCTARFAFIHALPKHPVSAAPADTHELHWRIGSVSPASTAGRQVAAESAPPPAVTSPAPCTRSGRPARHSAPAP